MAESYVVRQGSDAPDLLNNLVCNCKESICTEACTCFVKNEPAMHSSM